jgi:hypothetical protein
MSATPKANALGKTFSTNQLYCRKPIQRAGFAQVNAPMEPVALI